MKVEMEAMHSWEPEDFFASLPPGSPVDPIVRELIAWAAKHGVSVEPGTGSIPGLKFRIYAFNTFYPLFILTADTMGMNFGALTRRRVTADVRFREGIVKQLRMIPGVTIPPDRAEERPSFPITALRPEASMSEFLRIWTGVVDAVRSGRGVSVARSTDAHPIDKVLSDDGITSVGLARGMCFGTCPVYRVTLSSSGRVVYEGEYFVERIGQHRGEVDAERVAGLIGAILRLGFAELEPKYPLPDSPYHVTDMPSCELVLTSEQQSHRVIDRGDGAPAPDEFWAMAAAIDALVEMVEWDEPEDDDAHIEPLG